MAASCLDCGLDYAEFPLDTILSDTDWLRIHPEGEGGLLCAGCIAKRVAQLPLAIVLSARIIFSDEHNEWARSVRVERAAPELLNLARGAWHLFESLLAVREGVPDDGIRAMSDALKTAIAKAEGR